MDKEDRDKDGERGNRKALKEKCCVYSRVGEGRLKENDFEIN